MDEVIKIHARASFTREFQFEDDETGLLVDVSSKAIFLETEGGAFRKPLEPWTGGATTSRELFLSEGDIAQLPDTTTAFIFLDETVPGKTQNMGDGKLKRIGWSRKVS